MPPVDKEAKIPCPTPQHLQTELDALTAILELREQEDTWEKMERAIIRFTGVTRGGGYKHLPMFIDGMGKMGVGLKVGACMLSDRGRLSGVATELLQTLAPRLSSQFQPLVPIYLPPLVQLLGRPNKVFLKRAEKCLWTIITHCHLSSILFELRKGLADEAATCRRGCAAGIERALLEWDRGIFGEKGVGVVEEGLRKVGTDKDPEVRATGKRIWMKFSEIWPERVDEFSGPLTPTIRRYLGVAAANGGPSKAPLKSVRPVAMRPPPASLPASSSSSHAPASMPVEPVQHARVQALGGRAVRPTPAPVISEPEPPMPVLSESSRPRKSPVKAAFPAGPSAPSIPPVSAPPPPLDISEPPRQRIMSSRAPRYPPGVLGHVGRSVSHMVLSSTADIPPIDTTHNPLSQPSRPNLPTSFSTTSLPPDLLSGEAWRPQPEPVADRKFAPPARIIRTLTSDDLGPTTPHVLRGAVKSSQAQAGGQQRRGLGQAQRRVVTAPIPACPPPPEVDYTPLPQPALKASPSVKERIQEMEKRAGEVEAASVPLPSSPVAERFPTSNHASPSKTAKAAKQKEGRTMDSPFLPRMPERAGQIEEERMTGDLRDEEMPEEADVTISEPQRRDAQAEREEPIEVGKTVTARSSTSTEEPLVAISKADTVEMEVTPVDTPLLTPDDVSTDLSTKNQPSITAKGDSAPSADLPKPAIGSKPPTTTTAPIPAPAPAPTEPKSRKPPLPPAGPPRSRTEKPTSVTSASLPPVAAAKVTKPRVPSAETRKPFRPTTKAAVPTASSSASGASVPSTVTAGDPSTATTTTRNVPREPNVRPAKPPVPPVTTKSNAAAPKPAAVSTKTAVSASAPSAPKSVVPSAPPRIAATSSNLTKPTAASAHRVVVVSARTSKPPASGPTATAAATTLPPVKKEKIKRKAAVPSFRPVTKSASATSTSLIASTSSSARGVATKSTAGIRGGKGEIVARVKVRPEAIALPVSPGENRAEEIPLPPSSVLGEFTGRVRVKSRPSELSPTPAVRQDNGAEDGMAAGSGEAVSPLAAKIPLPASPTAQAAIATTSSEPVKFLENDVDEAMTTTHDEDIQPAQDAAPPSPIPEPKLIDQPILFHGSHPPSDQTPHSKASTAPALSDWMGSDSEEEEEPVESPRDRVFFGSRQRQGLLIGMRRMDMQRTEEKDLIEFSAPSRSAMGAGEENAVKGGNEEVIGKKSPEGVMGSPRVVLSERDANGVIRVEEVL